jgi:hypothetical protein
MTAFCFQGAGRGGASSGCFLSPAGSGLQPEFWKCAGGSAEWVGCRKADVAHSLKDFECGRGAADVPMFVLRIGSDHEEVLGGSNAAVARSRRKNRNVASVDGDRFATFASQNEARVTRSEA